MTRTNTGSGKHASKKLQAPKKDQLKKKKNPCKKKKATVHKPQLKTALTKSTKQGGAKIAAANRITDTGAANVVSGTAKDASTKRSMHVKKDETFPAHQRTEKEKRAEALSKAVKINTTHTLTERVTR